MVGMNHASFDGDVSSTVVQSQPFTETSKHSDHTCLKDSSDEPPSYYLKTRQLEDPEEILQCTDDDYDLPVPCSLLKQSQSLRLDVIEMYETIEQNSQDVTPTQGPINDTTGPTSIPDDLGVDIPSKSISSSASSESSSSHNGKYSSEGIARTTFMIRSDSADLLEKGLKEWMRCMPGPQVASRGPSRTISAYSHSYSYSETGEGSNCEDDTVPQSNAPEKPKRVNSKGIFKKSRFDELTIEQPVRVTVHQPHDRHRSKRRTSSKHDHRDEYLDAERPHRRQKASRPSKPSPLGPNQVNESVNRNQALPSRRHTTLAAVRVELPAAKPMKAPLAEKDVRKRRRDRDKSNPYQGSTPKTPVEIVHPNENGVYNFTPSAAAFKWNWNLLDVRKRPIGGMTPQATPTDAFKLFRQDFTTSPLAANPKHGHCFLQPSKIDTLVRGSKCKPDGLPDFPTDRRVARAVRKRNLAYSPGGQNKGKKAEAAYQSIYEDLVAHGGNEPSAFSLGRSRPKATHESDGRGEIRHREYDCDGRTSSADPENALDALNLKATKGDNRASEDDTEDPIIHDRGWISRSSSASSAIELLECGPESPTNQAYLFERLSSSQEGHHGIWSFARGTSQRRSASNRRLLATSSAESLHSSLEDDYHVQYAPILRNDSNESDTVFQPAGQSRSNSLAPRRLGSRGQSLALATHAFYAALFLLAVPIAGVSGNHSSDTYEGIKRRLTSIIDGEYIDQEVHQTEERLSMGSKLAVRCWLGVLVLGSLVETLRVAILFFRARRGVRREPGSTKGNFIASFRRAILSSSMAVAIVSIISVITSILGCVGFTLMNNSNASSFFARESRSFLWTIGIVHAGVATGLLTTRIFDRWLPKSLEAFQKIGKSRLTVIASCALPATLGWMGTRVVAQWLKPAWHRGSANDDNHFAPQSSSPYDVIAIIVSMLLSMVEYFEAIGEWKAFLWWLLTCALSVLMLDYVDLTIALTGDFYLYGTVSEKQGTLDKSSASSRFFKLLLRTCATTGFSQGSFWQWPLNIISLAISQTAN